MLQVYLHDGVSALTFVLAGTLDHTTTLELEHSWTTARSILRGRPLRVDLARLSSVDPAGTELLARMSQDGAQLLTATDPMDAVAARASGRPPRLLSAPPMGRLRRWVCRFSRCCGRFRTRTGRSTCEPPPLKVW